MKKLLNEFKDFAIKSNIFGMATGVIIGTAAGKVVSALVEGIIMPLIGLLLGGDNIDGIVLNVGGANIMLGNFLASLLDFIIILVFIFLVIKAYTAMQNELKKRMHLEEEKKDPAPTSEDYLKEIRDLLAKGR